MVRHAHRCDAGLNSDVFTGEWYKGEVTKLASSDTKYVVKVTLSPGETRTASKEEDELRVPK